MSYGASCTRHKLISVLSDVYSRQQSCVSWADPGTHTKLRCLTKSSGGHIGLAMILAVLTAMAGLAGLAAGTTQTIDRYLDIGAQPWLLW